MTAGVSRMTPSFPGAWVDGKLPSFINTTDPSYLCILNKDLFDFFFVPQLSGEVSSQFRT